MATPQPGRANPGPHPAGPGTIGKGTTLSANSRPRGYAVVAAAAGFGLLASPLALSSGALARGGSAAASASAAEAPQQHTWRAKLDLYAINDFHGQLETVPATSSSGRVGTTPAGGAEYLSTHLDQWRAASRARGAKPITVAAGDLIGASPLLSAAFHDEPAIETLNKVGLKVSSVGNHEFDEGYRELLRMQRGGCLPDGPDGANNQNSCPSPDQPFRGANFDYLAANVKYRATQETILPPYTVKRVDGEKVAFVGMTLRNTPNIVTKSGIAGLRFGDEVVTVNRLIPKIRAQGIDAIVVLLHEGLTPSPITDINACENAAGPGLEIAEDLHAEVDLVVSGHTHQPYVCTVRDPNGRKRMITSAYSVGRVVTEINLQIKRSNGEIVRSAVRATNRIVTNTDTAADDAISALIARYGELVAPIRDKVLGRIAPADVTNNLPKEFDGTDYELGNLIADSQKKEPSVAEGKAQPVAAFMNPGGIRTDLVENDAGDVTYGAAFNVQPFNNFVTSFDMTGEQILAVLNQQWNGANAGTLTAGFKILQVSGLKYTWDLSDATGDAANAVVGPVLIDENGDGVVEERLDPAKTYRVVANSFLAEGQDGFTTFANVADKLIGGLDIDALARELSSGTGAYTPPPTGRITVQP